MGGPSEPESSVKKDGIPLFTLIADINSVHGSDAKSIFYQKFNWQIEKRNPTCVDFTEPIDFVPTPSLFTEQLAIIPSETSTRVVLLVQRPEFTSPNTWDNSNEEAIVYSACSTAYEILETTYNVGNKSDLKPYDLNPKISQLGFFFGPYQYDYPRPRLRWTINDRGNCKTMVIYYWMWIVGIINDQSKEETARQHADTVVQSFVNHWNNFTNSDTQSIESSPIEFLIPLIQDLEAYFLLEIETRKHDIQFWLDPSSMDPLWELHDGQASRDLGLTKSWGRTRGIIESFELITQNLEDCQESMSDIHENGKIQRVIERHRKSLQRARELEQYVRDTIQLNVGNLSLQESRKSIQQANTLGRLSVLAFIFLPISLVTSFFGMNIHELTGSGASWKSFLIAAGILCGLGFLTFLWVFRKSPKLRFCFSLCCYPPVFVVLWCLVVGLKLMNLSYGWRFSRLDHRKEEIFLKLEREYRSLFPISR